MTKKIGQKECREKKCWLDLPFSAHSFIQLPPGRWTFVFILDSVSQANTYMQTYTHDYYTCFLARVRQPWESRPSWTNSSIRIHKCAHACNQTHGETPTPKQTGPAMVSSTRQAAHITNQHNRLKSTHTHKHTETRAIQSILDESFILG